MATQRRDISYQSLGNGVFRVSGAVRRSAVTGRYITKSATPAKPSPSATTSSAAKKR